MLKEQLLLSKNDIESLTEQQQRTFEKMLQEQKKFDQQIKREKANFEKALSKQKLSARARAAKQKAFLKKLQGKQDKMAKKISKMESKVQGIQGELDKSRQAQAKAESQSSSLAKKNQNLSSDIKKLQDIANARKKLIADMKNNLAKSGLKAEVGESGEVVIEFGEEYFETGQANMKPGMEKILKKFMPAYSKSLFSDPKTAEKIQSVEIVGYASPTYQGRYIDPSSLDKKDREAVNYNLSLSFNRAKSIFGYIFDKSKMNYGHQKTNSSHD